MVTMTRRAALVLVVIAVQVIVPVIAYFHLPSQYGFQMFSGLGWTHVKVLDVKGRAMPVDVLRHVHNFRDDIDWTQRLPEYLCAHVPGAASVTVERHRGSRTVVCP
jgi:hypothetical protein